MRLILNAFFGLIVLTSLAAPGSAGVTAGTAFTYQGELRSKGDPVNTPVDLTFRLFPFPAGGVQIGADIVLLNVPVSDGRFTVQLDFGSVFTTTTARFLEIDVEGVTLSPRQQITATPISTFSQNTRGITVDSDLDVAIGTASTLYRFQVFTDDTQRAIYGNNFDNTAGVKYGVYGRATATEGYGVFGLHDATTGTNAGVYGETDSTSANAVGVHGVVDATSPGNFSAAVRGENRGTGLSGIGVYGSHDGQGWGVYGTSSGAFGRGVYGHHVGTGGWGGYFSNDSGIALLADGIENNGSTAALVVSSGSQIMYIDGNEIDSNSSAGLHLNNNNTFDVVLAAGGGNVEMPDSGSMLNVAGSVHAQSGFFGYNNSGGGMLTTRGESDTNNSVMHVRFEATGVVGSITSFNGVVSYNAFTGSHFVTLTTPLTTGALVRMTGANQVIATDRPSETVYGVELAYQANDPACLGVYLSEHRDVFTANGSPIHLVAAVGNGDMMVVDDGRGNIEPGDLLISSDVPGCAMKDDPTRFATSYIVARAAQHVDWNAIEADAQGVKRCTISVLFDPTVRSGSEQNAALRSQLAEQQALIEAMQKRLSALESNQTK